MPEAIRLPSPKKDGGDKKTKKKGARGQGSDTSPATGPNVTASPMRDMEEMLYNLVLRRVPQYFVASVEETDTAQDIREAMGSYRTVSYRTVPYLLQ